MQRDDCPELPTHRIQLRPLKISDAENWHRYLAIPAAVGYLNDRPCQVADLEQLIASYLLNDPTTPTRYAVVERGDRAFIGTIGFHNISPHDRTAEIIFDIAPDYTGQGIATECCQAMTAWGLRELGFLRLQGVIPDTDAAGIRVMEKCGYLREGKLRSYRMVRGQSMDFWMYSRLARESLPRQSVPR
jgi:RimJ/RimL family protein N-acetyltransferase